VTDHDITALCQLHGAKAVSDAAYAAMRGEYKALSALGVSVIGIGALHRMTTIAYGQMSIDEQAMDAAQASINLSRLP